MDEDGVGLVLARAMDLRLKIGNCIHIASAKLEKEGDAEKEVMNDGKVSEVVGDEEDEEMGEDDEAETLLSIFEALEALETQLGSLQALQQQQQYEREAALADIENSRRKLLDKLKDYKGKDLEVIQEASAFAGETVEHNGDLLLPPYSSHPPQSLFLNNGNSPHFHSVHKSVHNGIPSNIANDSEEKEIKIASKDSRKGLGHFIGTAAKTAITIIGVISLLNLTGLRPKFTERRSAFNIQGIFQQTDTKEENVQCPPGRVLVMQNGEPPRLARERIEVPFEPIVSAPDVNYGCG